MVLLHIALVAAAAAAPPTRSFQLGGALNNSFSKDGLPFTFMAGSMHYWRSKPSEWRPKLQLMRELGLNAVLTPTIWARHEALEGQFDFSGDVDVVKFVRTAEEEGLLVVMRLGSYATAEMDLGGLPFWLINKNISTIRSLDPVWQRYEQRYFRQLLRRLTPLQYNHPAGGGPVVCVQLGDDSDVAILHNAYYALMAQEFRRWGVTVPINTLINTGDSGWWGAWNQADVVRLPSASGVFTAFEGVNLGGLPAQLAWMRKQFPQNNPLVNFEYYAGWIDLEGAAHPNARTPTVEAYAAGLEQQLSSNISVSLYMACGGTNFGYTGGGEWQGSKSVPIISSYDYSAPITEGGDVGPKFLPLQTVIRKHFPGTTPPPPVAGASPAIPKVAYGNITFTAAALLFQNLEVFRMSALSEPQNMEELGQGYGYILYSVPATSDDAPQTQVLTAPGLADRGLVYRGSELQGVLGAWAATHTLQLNFSSNPPRAAPLRILVSNEGRQSGELVSLAKNAKGILGNLPSKPVMLGSTALHAMNATHIELPEPATSWSARLRWKPLATATASTISQTAAVPAFYKATLIATGVDATFLRMDGWGHGVVFVNDVNLGRFSCLGPGRSLYVPTGVLRAGANSIVILETDRLGAPPIPTGSRARTVESVQIGPLWASKPAVE